MPAVDEALTYPDGQTTDLSMDKSKKSEGGASFLRAARAGNLEKVLEFLDAGTDINTCNANGLNALHLAAKEGHATVIRELLKRGANVDAATKKANTALHIAALAGQEEIVNILVQYKANVNVQSQNGFTPLYMAAQENHDKVVSYLLQNGANQSLTTEDGFTPLAVALQQGHDKVVAILLENDVKGKVRLPAIHIAAKKDDTKAATLLLQSEQNPDVTSKSGFTALHIAAHYGNESIATLLLEKGANVNFAARHNITPLHVAAKWGRVSLVTLLVAHGAVLDSKTRDLLTPLHCAARSGHDQVVDLLIEKGAEITAKTKNGLAPLHMAAQGDHVDCARILLYHKAPVDDVTVDFLTPLHVAAHCGHVRVAKLLLDRGADPNSRALNGFAPLHIACKKNRIKVVELLLKYNANLEAKTESGLTPLHVASFMGCMNIVVFLLQHETSPDVTTVRGETPLHLAARANQTDVVRILLRNNATVDARAREQQTPLHIASRLGNNDIVMLLLQAGADVNAATKDLYTPLHIAAKEGQEDVVTILLDQNADKTLQTKKGFTPIHLAAKYGNLSVVKLLLDKGAEVDVLGKNQVTPLHVAAHYDHQNVALLLLERNASPHSAAKNGYTPLHIAAKKNQLDIANTLLEYGANGNSESKAGFTPLHLAAQEGHAEMTYLLIDHGSLVNSRAKNGLTPMHLCAQEDRLEAAKTLKKFNAEIAPQTKAGYTPLHVACHFGQIAMVKFLLENGSDVNAVTKQGYTPLHQAAQQGHAAIIKLLLDNNAAPNAVTSQGQTPLAIAQRLGYVSVVETLRTVTETTVITEMTTVTEERYKVQAPETMQETFISDSEDEGEDIAGPDHSFGEDMKGLQDDSLPLDKSLEQDQLETLIQKVAHQQMVAPEPDFRMEGHYLPDNVEISRNAVHTGFMVDARGGAMRGCRHSGVRVIVPPRKAPAPMRITCRYLRKDRVIHPPLLVEGEALASRILEMGPAGAKFLGPVILEVPHFASLRGREREIVILRSDDGEHWKEHQLEATEDAVQDVLNESFDPEELAQLEDLQTTRISRILTNDFPQYFAVVTRIRQEVHAVGPEGGMITSTVVPQVSAVFPEGALTKTIKVSLQAQPVPHDLVTRLFGNNVTVSPIITVEPRRRKFHKPITLTIPVPQIGGSKANLSRPSIPTQETPPYLRLMCSITGGQAPAVWEDITGTTQLNFSNDTVSFTTTVSARFWLVDSQSRECARMAQEIYSEAILTPYMAKFVVFARRTSDPSTGQLRVFCMTDDKEDKTLEKQEHFTEVAKSRDVEVLAGKNQFVEFSGLIIPMTKSGDQLSIAFIPFQENRLPFSVRIKDKDDENVGGPAACRLAFMREPKYRPETLPPQHPICTLNVILPEYSAQGTMSTSSSQGDLLSLDRKYAQLKGPVVEKIHKADVRLSDVAKAVGDDWPQLAKALNVPVADVNQIRTEYPNQEALVTLRIWFERVGRKATGTVLERALRQIGRDDIVKSCAFNITPVKTEAERTVAEQLLSNGVHNETIKSDEMEKPTPKPRGASRDSVDGVDEQIVKVTETSQEKQVGDTIVVERTIETRKIITVHSNDQSGDGLLQDVLKELESDASGSPSVVITETKVTRRSIPIDENHDVLRYESSGLSEGPMEHSETVHHTSLRPLSDHPEVSHTQQELKDSHEWSGSFGSSSEHSGDTIIYRGDSGLVEHEDFIPAIESRKQFDHKRMKDIDPAESMLVRSDEVENLLEAVEKDSQGRKILLTQSQSVREGMEESMNDSDIHLSVDDLLLQNETEAMDKHEPSLAVPPNSISLECDVVKDGETAHVELLHHSFPHKSKSSPTLTYKSDGLCELPVIQIQKESDAASLPLNEPEIVAPPRKSKQSAHMVGEPTTISDISVPQAHVDMMMSPFADGLSSMPLSQPLPTISVTESTALVQTLSLVNEDMTIASEEPAVAPPRKHKIKEEPMPDEQIQLVTTTSEELHFSLETEDRLKFTPSGLCELEIHPTTEPSGIAKILNTEVISTSAIPIPQVTVPAESAELIPPKRHHRKSQSSGEVVRELQEESSGLTPILPQKEVRMLRCHVAPFGFETDPLLQHNEEYQARPAALLVPYEKGAELIPLESTIEEKLNEEILGEKPSVAEQINAFEQLNQKEVKEEPFVQRSEIRDYKVQLGKPIPEKEPLDVDVVCLSLGFGLQKFDKQFPLEAESESIDTDIASNPLIAEEPFVLLRTESPIAVTKLIEVPNLKEMEPVTEKKAPGEETFVHSSPKQFVAESWSGEHSVVQNLSHQTNEVLLASPTETSSVVPLIQTVSNGIPIVGGLVEAEKLSQIAFNLGETPNSIVVEGMTDGTPIVGGIVAKELIAPLAAETLVASSLEQEGNNSIIIGVTSEGRPVINGIEEAKHTAPVTTTTEVSADQISQFIQQTTKKHFEAITWSGEHQEPEPSVTESREVLVATSADQTQTEDNTNEPKRIFVAEPDGRITVAEKVSSEVPLVASESSALPQSSVEAQPQLQPSHRFEATEWSGEHQEVHLPPAEETEFLVATSAGQLESEATVEASGEPKKIIEGMAAPGEAAIEGISSESTNSTKPSDLLVSSETHFVRVESHKRFEATEWTGEHPEVSPPEMPTAGTEETAPPTFQIGTDEPAVVGSAEPTKERREGQYVQVSSHQMTERAEWTGDAKTEPPVTHERHVVTESEVYFVPQGDAAQPQLIVQNVTETGTPVIQGATEHQPADAKKEILAPFTNEIPGFSELIRQVTEGGEPNRDVQISYQKHHQKTTRETVFSSGGAEEPVPTPSPPESTVTAATPAESPKVPEFSQPSLPNFNPEISQISELIKQAASGGGEINISYEKQHQKSVKQTTFSGFQPTVMASVTPQTPANPEVQQTPQSAPTAPDSIPATPEPSATDASGVAKLLAEMQSFMSGAAAKGSAIQAEFKHHSTRTSRTITQEGNVGLSSTGKTEPPAASSEEIGGDQISQMLKGFGIGGVGLPTQISEALQQHLGGMPAGSSTEMKFQSQHSTRQVTCESTGATSEEMAKQMEKITGETFGVPSKGVGTPSASTEPLIRLKVNEKVFQGVLDDQQHIHLRKLTEEIHEKKS